MSRRLSALFLLCACGSKTSDTGGGAASSVDEGFLPSEGSWAVTALEPVENTCGLPTDELTDLSDGDPTLRNAVDSTFALSFPNGGASLEVTCTLTGKSFDCGTHRLLDEDLSDGSVVLDAQLYGAFSTEAEAVLDNDGEVSCTGSECADIEADLGASLPCTAHAQLRIQLAD